jgi:hypothetical protein
MSNPDYICNATPPCSYYGFRAAIQRDHLECFKNMLANPKRNSPAPERLLDCAHEENSRSIYLLLRGKGMSASAVSLDSFFVVNCELSSTRWKHLSSCIRTAAEWDRAAGLDMMHLDTFERRIKSKFSPPVCTPPEFDVLTCQNDGDCSICQRSDPPDRIAPQCGHGFHPACLIRWMMKKNNNTCPECLTQVLQQDDVEK